MLDRPSGEGLQFNRNLLLGGGVLLGVGGLIALTGVALVGSALISVTRQWVDQLERPPSEIARRRWEQAKAAAAAGASAWRDEAPSGS